MSRSFVRTLVIAVVCMAVALLAGTTLAAARGNNPIMWATSRPGPAISQNGPNASSPISTPPNGPNAAQDADGNGAADAEAPGSEGSEVGEQNANEAGEQEIAGSVASIDTNNSMFTLNTATGMVVVAVTSQTEFGDGLTALSGLHQGMNVQVDAVSQGTGHALAYKVNGTPENGASEGSDASGPESNQ